VERITVKAMLRPHALARLSAPEHRFCPTPSCPIVYFGLDETFNREDVIVPVFQKEPPGKRPVCYCMGIAETDIHRAPTTAAERITALVKAERCACEIKNPQGSCCLGNVAAAVSGAQASTAGSRNGPGGYRAARE
jgi:hypothetical protein